jgi:hypothetical protein
MASVTYWSNYSLFIVVSWLQAGFLSRQEHNHLVSCDAAVCIPAITGSKPFCLTKKSWFICRWFRHISEAAEAYKIREGRNRRTEPFGLSVSATDNEASESTQDKTKE